MSTNTFIFNYHNYPVIPVMFAYKNKKTPLIDALLDSGGDFVVIPMPIASYLGLKLKKAGSVDTAGGCTFMYKAKLDMAIVSSKDKNTFNYDNHQVHVADRDDIPVLLGRQPIFEDYEITFRKRKNQLILKQANLLK